MRETLNKFNSAVKFVLGIWACLFVFAIIQDIVHPCKGEACTFGGATGGLFFVSLMLGFFLVPAFLVLFILVWVYDVYKKKHPKQEFFSEDPRDRWPKRKS